jgi:hypothetical protein
MQIIRKYMWSVAFKHASKQWLLELILIHTVPKSYKFDLECINFMQNVVYSLEISACIHYPMQIPQSCCMYTDFYAKWEAMDTKYEVLHSKPCKQAIIIRFNADLQNPELCLKVNKFMLYYNNIFRLNHGHYEWVCHIIILTSVLLHMSDDTKQNNSSCMNWN